MEKQEKERVSQQYAADAMTALHDIVMKEEAKDADRIAAAKLLLGMGEMPESGKLEVVMEVPPEFLV